MAESIEVQLARFDEQLKGLRQIVEGAKFVAEQVHENAKQLAVHDDRFNDLRGDLTAVEARFGVSVSRVERSCNDLGDLLREVRDEMSRVRAEQEKVKADQAEQKQVTTATVQGRYAVIAALVGGAAAIILHLLDKL